MSPLFEKPFALSIGPQKCGSKRLEQYFKARGDICLPADVQETFFFDRHFQRGEEFYKSYFDVQEEHALIVELTTTAFDTLEAPEHVFEVFQDNVVLFCPLRHPVYRSYAVYRDYLEYGIVSGSIKEAADQAPQILHSSRYSEHLERWFIRFGAPNIKVTFYEDLQKDENAYIADLCRYLNVPYIAPADVLRNPHTQSRRTLPSFINEFVKGFLTTKEEISGVPSRDLNTIEWLFDRLSDDINKCEDLLGHSLPRPHDE